MENLPESVRRVLHNVDLSTLALDAHADGIIPRVLEHGDLSSVRWLLKAYGRPRIHEFLRHVGSTILSDKTISFWRAALAVGDQQWADPRHWRRKCGPRWES